MASVASGLINIPSLAPFLRRQKRAVTFLRPRKVGPCDTTSQRSTPAYAKRVLIVSSTLQAVKMVNATYACLNRLNLRYPETRAGGFDFGIGIGIGIGIGEHCMKHYKSVIWKYPILSTKDNDALCQLRHESGLRLSCGIEDSNSPLGWVNDYYGPELSKEEQELLMLKKIK
jgi:hypothetical protein